MYEDQYLSYFKRKLRFIESEYYENGHDKYLKEFGYNGDLDVKDVKDDKVMEEYQNSKISICSFISFDLFFKENLMSEKYPFIKRQTFIYEVCDRYDENSIFFNENGNFYRRFIIFDPINKNYFLPRSYSCIDFSIYALNIKPKTL